MSSGFAERMKMFQNQSSTSNSQSWKKPEKKEEKTMNTTPSWKKPVEIKKEEDVKSIPPWKKEKIEEKEVTTPTLKWKKPVPSEETKKEKVELPVPSWKKNVPQKTVANSSTPTNNGNTIDSFKKPSSSSNVSPTTEKKMNSTPSWKKPVSEDQQTEVNSKPTPAWKKELEKKKTSSPTNETEVKKEPWKKPTTPVVEKDEKTEVVAEKPKWKKPSPVPAQEAKSDVKNESPKPKWKKPEPTVSVVEKEIEKSKWKKSSPVVASVPVETKNEISKPSWKKPTTPVEKDEKSEVVEKPKWKKPSLVPAQETKSTSSTEAKNETPKPKWKKPEPVVTETKKEVTKPVWKKPTPPAVQKEEIKKETPKWKKPVEKPGVEEKNEGLEKTIPKKQVKFEEPKPEAVVVETKVEEEIKNDIKVEEKSKEVITEKPKLKKPPQASYIQEVEEKSISTPLRSKSLWEKKIEENNSKSVTPIVRSNSETPKWKKPDPMKEETKSVEEKKEVVTEKPKWKNPIPVEEKKEELDSSVPLKPKWKKPSPPVPVEKEETKSTSEVKNEATKPKWKKPEPVPSQETKSTSPTEMKNETPKPKWKKPEPVVTETKKEVMKPPGWKKPPPPQKSVVEKPTEVVQKEEKKEIIEKPKKQVKFTEPTSVEESKMEEEKETNNQVKFTEPTSVEETKVEEEKVKSPAGLTRSKSIWERKQMDNSPSTGSSIGGIQIPTRSSPATSPNTKPITKPSVVTNIGGIKIPPKSSPVASPNSKPMTKTSSISKPIVEEKPSSIKNKPVNLTIDTKEEKMINVTEKKTPVLKKPVVPSQDSKPMNQMELKKETNGLSSKLDKFQKNNMADSKPTPSWKKDFEKKDVGSPTRSKSIWEKKVEENNSKPITPSQRSNTVMKQSETTPKWKKPVVPSQDVKPATQVETKKETNKIGHVNELQSKLGGMQFKSPSGGRSATVMNRKEEVQPELTIEKEEIGKSNGSVKSKFAMFEKKESTTPGTSPKRSLMSRLSFSKKNEKPKSQENSPEISPEQKSPNTDLRRKQLTANELDSVKQDISSVESKWKKRSATTMDSPVNKNLENSNLFLNQKPKSKVEQLGNGLSNGQPFNPFGKPSSNPLERVKKMEEDSPIIESAESHDRVAHGKLEGTELRRPKRKTRKPTKRVNSEDIKKAENERSEVVAFDV
eukprot:gene1943-1451_t